MTTLTNALTIRSARAEDSETISALILRVARTQLRNEFTQDGWELFLRLMSTQTLSALITNERFCYWLASLDSESDSKIIGLLASRDANHVFHFFVDPDYQKRGVGKFLWRHYLFHLTGESPQLVTVKASDYAINFYKKLGFTIVQPRQIEKGLAYTLMHFVRSNP